MEPVEFRSALDELGWSQAEFARQAGLDPTTVSRWMSGKTPGWVAGFLEPRVDMARLNRKYRRRARMSIISVAQFREELALVAHKFGLCASIDEAREVFSAIKSVAELKAVGRYPNPGEECTLNRSFDLFMEHEARAFIDARCVVVKRTKAGLVQVSLKSDPSKTYSAPLRNVTRMGDAE